MLRSLLVMAVFVLAPATDSPFEGSWSMVTRMGEREIPATMTLSFAEDGATGEWHSQGLEMTLSSIEIDGTAIRFDREVQVRKLSFSGTLDGDTLEGNWSGAFGELPCSGKRAGEAGEAVAEGPEDEGPGFHDRPIVEEDGKRKLWAGETDEGEVEWFDMTDSTIDPHRFQFGIGKDTIPSIDAPEFVAHDDPMLASRGVTGETPVLGVTIDGISRAYPVAVMDMHEVVNDTFGGKAFAVLW